MDFKKFMQEKQDKNPVITQDDEEFFNAVVLKDVEANVAARKKGKRPVRTVWACVSAAATVLAAAVITVSVLFANRGPSPIFYQDANVIHIESTLEELQQDLKYFEINESEQNIRTEKSYDSESADTLYYKVRNSFAVIDIELTIVVNENYNYKFEIVNETTTKPLDSYVITYVSEPISDITGIPKINYRGWVKVETETVYFEYQQLLTMGDDAFFEGIQNIIKVK